MVDGGDGCSSPPSPTSAFNSAHKEIIDEKAHRHHHHLVLCQTAYGGAAAVWWHAQTVVTRQLLAVQYRYRDKVK